MFMCLSNAFPYNDIRRVLENDEIAFQNVNGHREPINVRLRRTLITCCVFDFFIGKKKKLHEGRNCDAMLSDN